MPRPMAKEVVMREGRKLRRGDSMSDEIRHERTSVLEEAESLVHGARNSDYGPPIEDFSRTATVVSALLAHKLKEPLTAEDVGMFMCCVKLSRQAHKPKRDNMVDLAGYAECVQWIVEWKEEEEEVDD